MIDSKTARTYRCPMCGAHPGQPCWTTNDTPRKTVHRDREGYAVAQEQKKKEDLATTSVVNDIDLDAFLAERRADRMAAYEHVLAARELTDEVRWLDKALNQLQQEYLAAGGEWADFE